MCVYMRSTDFFPFFLRDIENFRRVWFAKSPCKHLCSHVCVYEEYRFFSFFSEGYRKFSTGLVCKVALQTPLGTYVCVYEEYRFFFFFWGIWNFFDGFGLQSRPANTCMHICACIYIFKWDLYVWINIDIFDEVGFQSYPANTCIHTCVYIHENHMCNIYINIYVFNGFSGSSCPEQTCTYTYVYTYR